MFAYLGTNEHKRGNFGTLLKSITGPGLMCLSMLTLNFSTTQRSNTAGIAGGLTNVN